MNDNVGCGRHEFKYSEAVAVTLSRSRRGAVAIGAATAATLAVVALTPLPVALQSVLAMAVVAGALDGARRNFGARAVAGLRVDRMRHVEIDHARGGRSSGVLQAGCFVAPWLTIVRWRPDGARFDRTLIVLPDMLEAEAFRRLRVLLRWT